MKKRIKIIITHPLIAGSGVIFIGTFIGNIFNFLFVVYMGRSLSPADYGALIALVSLITLFGLAVSAIIPTIITFAGKYFAEKDYAVVKGLFTRTIFFVGCMGVIICFISMIFTKQIASFFNISQSITVPLTAFAIFWEFLAVVNLAFIQARLSFKLLTVINALSGILKLIFGVMLIALGLKVVGGVSSYLFSYVLIFLISFLGLKFLFYTRSKSSSINFSELIAYGMPSAVATVCLTSFITTDTILVKHFFTPHQAGLYAGMSTIGKVIFFFSAPIVTVMFPLIVKKLAKKEDFHPTFQLAVLLVVCASLIITVTYFIFPSTIITLFYKNTQYLAIKNLLGFYGIFITLYSIVYLVLNFFLSIKKTSVYIPTLIASVVQVVLISLFHSSFLSVIIISITVLSLLLIVFFVYYLRLEKITIDK